MSKGKDWKKNLEEIWKVQKTLEPHLNSCNLCRCMRKGMAGRWFQSQLPFLSPGFLFTLRIKKEVMLLYSKPFKSATGCLCIRSLNALTEEMNENCHHPLISFKTSTWGPSWSEGKKKIKKNLSTLSHNTPFEQLPLKPWCLFIQQESFLHLEETVLAPGSSNKPSSRVASSAALNLGLFQPHGHHWACRTWVVGDHCQRLKTQFSVGQLQHPSHLAWAPMQPALWLIIFE